MSVESTGETLQEEKGLLPCSAIFVPHTPEHRHLLQLYSQCLATAAQVEPPGQRLQHCSFSAHPPQQRWLFQHRTADTLTDSPEHSLHSLPQHLPRDSAPGDVLLDPFL